MNFIGFHIYQANERTNEKFGFVPPPPPPLSSVRPFSLPSLLLLTVLPSPYLPSSVRPSSLPYLLLLLHILLPLPFLYLFLACSLLTKKIDKRPVMDPQAFIFQCEYKNSATGTKFSLFLILRNFLNSEIFIFFDFFFLHVGYLLFLSFGCCSSRGGFLQRCGRYL
jgi:hypothetical protein